MLRSTQLMVSRFLERTSQTQSIRRQAFHKDYNAAQEEQSFKLSDGRTMGFAEYGSLTGSPAFFFHGSPGSRYDGQGLIDVAKKLNIRIISPDRPGHGLSSFQQNRKLGDYPNDISQLAKYLGISKYSVFGQSGGGPYAVACAHGSPKDELLNAGVIAGIGPPAVLTVKTAGLYTVAVLNLATWMSNLTRSLMKWSLGNDMRLQKQLDYTYKYLTEEDRALLAGPEAQSIIMAGLKAAFAQGPDGVIRDAQIYNAPWDFELKDVKRKVTLFYGCKDDRTPLAFGRYYEEQLPNAELVRLQDVSHYTLYKYDEEILAKIVGTEPPKSVSEEDE